MKRLILDIDGTIALRSSGQTYMEALPNRQLVERLKEYRQQGFEIVLYSSRNMRTYNSSLGKINAITLPLILEWLKKHDIPYDEVYVGKPWCGEQGFYVDDKAIRPSEFAKLSYDQIRELIGREGAVE